MLGVIFLLIGLHLCVDLWLLLFSASWFGPFSLAHDTGVLLIDEKVPEVLCALHCAYASHDYSDYCDSVVHFWGRLKVRRLVVDPTLALT